MNTKRLYTLAEIDALPDLEYLIEGIIPDKAFCLINGDPGCGKTFVALSMALACANGKEWIGRKTQPANVLYIAAEGVLGMKYRLRAYQCLNKIVSNSIQFCTEAVQVTNSNAIEQLLKDLKEANFFPSLIIIDTLARVSVGKDENSAKDMGEIVAAVEKLQRKLNTTILLIHHNRKNGEGERGSSALRGAVDVQISIRKDIEFENIVILSCVKTKDDEPFNDIEVGLNKVELKNGRSSLVADIPPPLLSRKMKSGKTDKKDLNSQKILKFLDEMFGKEGATHGELKKAYCEQSNINPTSFDRSLRALNETKGIQKVGDGKGARYFLPSVSVNSVSPQCQDTLQNGVMSSPL